MSVCLFYLVPSLSTSVIIHECVSIIPAILSFYFIHFVCGRKNRLGTASELVILFYPLCLWAKESLSDCQQAGNCILSTFFVGERIAW